MNWKRLVAIVSTFIPLLSAYPAFGMTLAILETSGGLYIATFETSHGRIKLYLPDDIAAGDAISATVSLFPVGISSKDADRNRAELAMHSFEFFGESRKAALSPIKWNVPVKTGFAALILKDKAAKQAAAVQIRIKDPSQAEHSSDYQFPVAGQSGMSAEILGRFDGNIATTELTLSGKRAKIFAESPRKLLFESPVKDVGRIEIVLTEQGVSRTHSYNNLRVVRVGETQITQVPTTRISPAPQEIVEPSPPVEIPSPPQPPSEEIGVLTEEVVAPPTPTPAPAPESPEADNAEPEIDEALISDPKTLFPENYSPASETTADEPASDAVADAAVKDESPDVAQESEGDETAETPESNPPSYKVEQSPDADSSDAQTPPDTRAQGLSEQDIAPPAIALERPKETPPNPTVAPESSEQAPPFVLELPEEMQSPPPPSQNEQVPAQENNPTTEPIAAKSTDAELNRRNTESVPAAESDEASVERFIDAFAASYKSGDLERFIPLFDSEAKDGAQILETYSRRFASFESLNYEIRVERVDFFGDIAIVDGEYSLSEKPRDSSEAVNSDGRISFTLVRRGDLWKIDELQVRQRTAPGN